MKRLLAFALSLALLLSLCAFASAEGEYKDIINIADNDQGASYDLHKDTSVNVRNMLRGTVYEQLVTLKASGDIGPELCESYDINENSTEFVFHLRKNVKFHNGKDMTSADVVASLNRWLENFSVAGSMLIGMLAAVIA